MMPAPHPSATPPEIYILHDYRRAFLSTHASRLNHLTMDIDRVAVAFERHGMTAHILGFGDVDWSRSWQGTNIVYTSSEDIGLKYKSYIEDVVLGLGLAGANMMPRYELLRSHHNKVAMEALRWLYFPDEAKSLDTKLFGTMEEGLSSLSAAAPPLIVKSSEGAGATGVVKADNLAEARAAIREMSRDPFSFLPFLREQAKRLLKKDWTPRSLHRQKFITQNLINGLQGDCKILNFFGRFYVLYRHNRPDDFRASGSGLFSHDIPADIPLHDLLSYAETASNRIDAPTLSLDIGYDGTDFHLIEFQAVHFGTLTAELSVGYWQRDAQGNWSNVDDSCVIEDAYARAVADYVGHKLATDQLLDRGAR